MPLNFPESRDEILQATQTDVQNVLPESNPFLLNSELLAILTAYAGRQYDSVLLQQQLLKQVFPDTAEDEFLERWGSYKGVNRNPATQATGNVVATGTAGSVIPISTTLQVDGNSYLTDAAATITAQVLSVSSLVRSGSVVTVTTASNHSLASNISATISGANETDYNGTFIITVTGLDTFTYTISTTPTTPATGTITASVTFANIGITSVDTGQALNLSAGTGLSLSSPIAGVNNTLYADFSGIAGGTDTESDDDYSIRVREAYADPVALFNVNQIEQTAKTVSGVTRVFVEEITPAIGQVTIYFTRDNDDNVIPSAQEVQAVKDAIDAIKPAHVDTNDVIVSAPTAVNVNFVFTSLTPNTSTMQAAVSANLAALFEDKTTVGQDLKQVAYESAIFGTVDTTTGQSVSDFTLSSPSGDITANSGELPVLGTITYS